MALTRDMVFWDAFTNHAELTVKAASLLHKMLENPSNAPKLAEEITKLEADGDQITHDVVLALHQTWITPLDREEIHSLISRLDDVLDFVEAASDRITLYEIETAAPEALDLVTELQGCAVAIAKAVKALQSIKESKPLLDLCREVNDHESAADQILRRGLARLFKGGSADPFMVMKWRDILEMIETATDRAEDVANIIEGIVLEHS